jgi:3',5'-cyclic AMP phosphodiesterase CpdA
LLLCQVLAVPARAEDPMSTLIAVGDIANCEKSKMERGWFEWFLESIHLKEAAETVPGATVIADQVERLPGTILALGDLAYPEGSESNIKNCLDRLWSDSKDRTRLVPGNHDFKSDKAEPYYEYWGASAGKPRRGYYSFDLASWHILALNSNIGSKKKSKQYAWLRKDLRATNASCILAYWHHPVFSSGKHGNASKMKKILRLLYDHGVTIVLAGHDHTYERFAPQDHKGRRDDDHGFVQFVVGTGGSGLREPPIEFEDNSESFSAENLGVLKLELFERRYNWEFLPASGPEFHDSGSAQCVERALHGARTTAADEVSG